MARPFPFLQNIRGNLHATIALVSPGGTQRETRCWQEDSSGWQWHHRRRQDANTGTHMVVKPQVSREVEVQAGARINAAGVPGRMAQIRKVMESEENRRRTRGGWNGDLQLISSLIPSSTALPGIKRFSDRQDKYLPASSAEGVKLKTLVVWLPSIEILSLTRFSDLDPFHQEMLAGGREPEDRHVISTVFSAENALRSPSIRTRSGRTVDVGTTAAGAIQSRGQEEGHYY